MPTTPLSELAAASKRGYTSASTLNTNFGDPILLFALFETMRPRQWTKNAFVFAALVFDGTLEDLGPRLIRVSIAFVLLCFVSSSVYIMNDLSDIESDRQHPKKKNRPLPSGRLSIPFAIAGLAVFGLGSVTASFFLSTGFGIVVMVYVVMQIGYTFGLKQVVLLDVMIIAAGFVLRVAAGVAVIQVQRFSPWLYLCMGFGALFLALGKRRHELVLLGSGAGKHRKILEEYSIDLIDRLITMVLSATIVSYAMYTFLSEGLPENNAMMLTIPFVLYGVSRYLYLILVREKGGAPEEVLLTDRPFQITILLWGLTVIGVLYIF